MNANDKQVGGSHYKTKGNQHWDYMIKYGIPYIVGITTKYVIRKKDDRLQDLNKAMHCIDKMIEVEEGYLIILYPGMTNEQLKAMSRDLNLDNDQEEVCRLLLVSASEGPVKALQKARLKVGDMIASLECGAGPGYVDQG